LRLIWRDVLRMDELWEFIRYAAAPTATPTMAVLTIVDVVLFTVDSSCRISMSVNSISMSGKTNPRGVRDVMETIFVEYDAADQLLHQPVCANCDAAKNHAANTHRSIVHFSLKIMFNRFTFTTIYI
jgi:hypothetical protein